MGNSNSFDDTQFINSLRACTFPPELFTHQAHLRLAWIYLQNFSIDEAVKHVCEDLFRYVLHLGATDKYHNTLTVASVNVIAHFQRKFPSTTFEEFLLNYPQLSDNFKEILLTYYSPELLYSQVAKDSFVEPDLLPFTN